MTNFADLKSEYENLWAAMKIRPERAATVDAIARRLIGHKSRYQAVEDETGVPWFVIAALHNRESDADFDTYLGNGEPLDRETRLAPRGRGPFESWEEGAVDALELDHLDEVEDWTPARACYEVEKFNGFGYRNNHPNVKSPYLWSFTNHYTSGKYVGDGQFSAGAVDKQCGAIPVLKRIMEIARVGFDDDDVGAGFKPAPTSPGRGWGFLLRALFDVVLAIWRTEDRRRRTDDSHDHPSSDLRPPSSVPWMRWALKEVGFHEIGQNRGIGKYTSLAKCGGEGDPWCAIFVNAALEACDIRGTRSAMARSFEHSEHFLRLAGPAYGSITTMWRGTPGAGTGHVFFYLGENDRGVVALGGNQSDQVCRQYEPRNRIVGHFWPKSHPLPKIGKITLEADAEEGTET